MLVGLRGVISSVGKVSTRIYIMIFICLIVYIPISVGGTIYFLHTLYDWLSTLSAEWSWTQHLPEWASKIGSNVSKFIICVVSLVFLSIIGGCIILIVISPLLGKVAEKMWKNKGGNGFKSGAKANVINLRRTIVITLRTAITQAALTIFAFGLSFVPVVGFVAPFISLAINSYFYGISFSDYALELAGRDYKTSLLFCKSNKGIMVGLGLPFAIVLLIPFLGQYVGLFLAPIAVSASTDIVWDKVHEE